MQTCLNQDQTADSYYGSEHSRRTKSHINRAVQVEQNYDGKHPECQFHSLYA